MEITELTTVEKHVIVNVLCNKCGKSCKTEYGYDFESTSCLADWGYGSGKDGVTEHWNLCEPCSDAFVSTLKIPPTRL